MELAGALARSVRSGATVAGAVVAVGSAPEGRAVTGFADVAGEVRRGTPLEAAVDRWSGCWVDPGPAMLGAALVVASSTGGGAARALDRVAVALVAQWELGLEITAVTAPARASAMVLAALPPAAVLILSGLGASPGVWLEPLGLVCLAVGGVLELVGVLWMRRRVQRAVPRWEL